MQQAPSSEFRLLSRRRCTSGGSQLRVLSRHPITSCILSYAVFSPRPAQAALLLCSKSLQLCSPSHNAKDLSPIGAAAAARPGTVDPQQRRRLFAPGGQPGGLRWCGHKVRGRDELPTGWAGACRLAAAQCRHSLPPPPGHLAHSAHLLACLALFAQPRTMTLRHGWRR